MNNKNKSVKRLKSIRKIKDEKFRGMRIAIAKQANVSLYSVHNVLDEKTGNKILIKKVRLAATKVLDDYKKAI